MTGLMKRIFRRREPGQPPRRGVPNFFRRRGRAEPLPGYKRFPSFRLPARLNRWPWQPAPAPPPAPNPEATAETHQVVADPGPPSFKDRGTLRRRLRFLRRARELGFRDIGGLIFDMRRFERSRPDLLDAKLDALLAVDHELRALERILDDRRPFHELREPGISSCARCGALHASEANFCPQCGMQFGGPRAMGEVGGAIAAPPQAPVQPGAAPVPAPAPAASVQPEWPWPAQRPPADQPTAPTAGVDPITEQLTVAYVPVLQPDPPETGPAPAAPADPEPEPEREAPAADVVAEPAAKPAAIEPDAEPPEPVAEPKAKPRSRAKRTPAAKPAPATADDDGASAPQDAETDAPAAQKPAARKPRVRKPSTRKPAARPANAAKPAPDASDPAQPADPHADDDAAAEQPTEIHAPPQASGGS